MNAAAAPGADTLRLIRELIAFPTVSRDSNLQLIDHVRELLRPLDPELRLTFDNDRRKANLFATLGPRGEPGIVLSGHTDVVPVDGQQWTSDPFVLAEREGRLYGRGTSDMKAFIACVLALVPAYVARGLKTPLHLAFSYDEEVGCLGVRGLLADMVAAGIRPKSCIVGEPTEMRPVIAHKGKQSYRCSVRGLASHSAYAPLGVNAVEAAAEAVAFLKQLARRHRDRGPYDRGFDIAYTTVHTGVIRGGTALNIVPQDCVFDFEFRNLPGDDPERLRAEFEHHVRSVIEPEMHAVDPGTGFTIEKLSEIPALDTGPEAGITALAQEFSECSETLKVSFGTEASQFQVAGVPTVVCGPGSIRQAHKPDEFVALEQVARCERFLHRLMAECCR
ncbi:MAG: acetylornithine deacetylase [Burkholderiales bacterium]|jgi:acetylornithine deacetylase|nr:acetylornithine deacetylase [Burkholderiales bacterium]